jgi:ABC-2 type transport system permease protein
MITVFRALVRRDIRLFLNDRRAVLMSVVAPIVVASFFGFVMGGQSGKPETSAIPVAVIDNDQSAISRGIVEKLGEDKALEVKTASLDEARAAVRKGKLTVAIVIPKSFGDDAGRAFFGPAQKPALEILYDPSHSVEFNMVQGILTGQVMQVVSKEMFSGESGRRLIDDSLKRLDSIPLTDPAERQTLSDLLGSVEKWNAQSRGGNGPAASAATGGLNIPYQVHPEAVTASREVRYNGYAHAFAGMGVQFVLFLGIDVGINMLQQRQRGLWKRLRAAPLSRAMLLGSRAISAALISTLILIMLFVFARMAFGVHIAGSRAGFLGVCAAFGLMTATFGLLIAALGKTPEATRGLSVFVTLILVMLGGAWAPTFIFPPWLQTVTLAMPTRWAIDGLEATSWRGLGFSAAINPIAVLLLFAAAFGMLAVTRFRWEDE